MSNKSKIDICSLWLPLILIGLGLFCKPLFTASRPSIEKPIHVSNRNVLQLSNSKKSAIEPLSVETKLVYKNFAPLKYPTVKQPVEPVRRNDSQSQLRSVAAVGEASSYDSAAVSKELQDIEYQARQEEDFLVKKVGLSHVQLEFMNLKRSRYLLSMKQLAELEIRHDPRVSKMRTALNLQHVTWMTQLMGADNYHEYLEFSARTDDLVD